MKRLALSLSLLAAPAFAAPPAAAAPAGAEAKKPEVKKPAPAVTFKEGLSKPESVFYDATTDTYLVSNINGSETDKDNNGYITEFAPNGAVVNAKLIAAGQKGATLHAPKGLALVGSVLYVADIDTVRMFDRQTGATKGEVRVPGATFVNDVCAGADGKVYVSDSGLSPKFEPTGTDAVYVIEPGKKPTLTALIKSKDLPRPNGLVVTADTLYVNFFGAAEVRAYDLTGKPKGAAMVTPKGGLDGLVLVGADFLVSSWDGKAVYRGKPGGEFKVLVSDANAPADIGFDSKRSRVLIPKFEDNAVEAWDLK